MTNRREELKRTLQEGELEPEKGERRSSLRRGKVVGGGLLRTRINWGVAVLALGVILFIVWLVLKNQAGG